MTVWFVTKTTFAVYPAPLHDDFPHTLELARAFQGVIAKLS
jgi:hypothetical protein